MSRIVVIPCNCSTEPGRGPERDFANNTRSLEDGGHSKGLLQGDALPNHLQRSHQLHFLWGLWITPSQAAGGELIPYIFFMKKLCGRQVTRRVLTTSASFWLALLGALSSLEWPVLSSLSRWFWNKRICRSQLSADLHSFYIGEAANPDNWVSVQRSLALSHLSFEE